MALKLIETVQNTTEGHKAKVYWDRDWEEYRVRFYRFGEDYTGIMLNAQNRITAKFQEVTYNPYKHECFVMKGMWEPIFDSLEAYLTPEKKVYAIYW